MPQAYLVFGDLCVSAAISVVVLLLVEAPAARLLALVTSGLCLYCALSRRVIDIAHHSSWKRDPATPAQAWQSSS